MGSASHDSAVAVDGTAALTNPPLLKLLLSKYFIAATEKKAKAKTLCDLSPSPYDPTILEIT